LNYPDLQESKIICLDIETKDPNLIKFGTGVYRKDGFVIGVAIANDKGFSEYYPLRHPETTLEESKRNEEYLKEQLKTAIPKLGTNILYDLDWLVNGMGWEIGGVYNDIQLAEPLLDENAKSFSLNTQALKYLNKPKYKDEIDEYCEERGWKLPAAAHLWKMPAHVVRKYAITDVLEPIEIFRMQQEELNNQGLYPLYAIERGQLPLLLKMRKNGIRIDVDRVADRAELLQKEIDREEKELFDKYGKFNVNSGKQIAPIMDKLGVKYPLTDSGNPSFTTEVLMAMEHPIGDAIAGLKRKKKIQGTFLKGSFTEHEVNGRIHGTLSPLKGDDGGTVSGRYSMRNPNLQQTPAPKIDGDTLARFCREVFLAEKGYFLGKIDYSQVEYRVFAHYAVGPGADLLREEYINDPRTDYHRRTVDKTGLPRKVAKTLNFGVMYSMGPPTCSKKFGWDIEETKKYFKTYHDGAPYVKFTTKSVIEIAKARGYVKTILNRRARASAEMIKKRSYYVMLNRLIQGSAADIMKKAMYDADQSGIFDVLIPHLTVHDELVVSVPDTKEGAINYLKLKYVMENCVPLDVPLIADAELGDNWGNCTKERFTEFILKHLGEDYLNGSKILHHM
jgi:DNA polymerase-1